MKRYPVALHIFRRDLRLYDNTALHEALKLSNDVIPCFIFDSRQIDNNEYKSNNCIQFMVNSLKELNGALNKVNAKLYIFYGIPEEIIAKLIPSLNIKGIFINRDYTPFSRERDKKLAQLCHKFNIDLNVYADALLHEPEEVLKSNNKPYTVFTPFLKKVLQLHVNNPRKTSYNNFYKKQIHFEDKQILIKLSKIHNPSIFVKGGRSEALSLMKKIVNLVHYESEKDIPYIYKTTRLSAHNKFGTLSIRELYAIIKNNFGINHSLIKELVWRDFFTHIAFHFPHVFVGPFNTKFKNIPWCQKESYFTAWCEGRTGFPIVDAGMRELNTTGFISNRMRMVTASFLIKDLHIDWRKGEKYFAQQLVDYDASVNNGNWQWVASTGCDAQPYFRIFNPWLQQKKYDPDCIYIKRWVPELIKLSAKEIHNMYKLEVKPQKDYPLPIVDHRIASEQIKTIYKKF